MADKNFSLSPFKKPPFSGRFFAFTVLFLLISLLAISSLIYFRQQPVHVISGETMGTTFNIKYRYKKRVSPETQASLKAAVFSELEAINSEINHYDPLSQISLFNTVSGEKMVQIGTHFRACLKISEQAHALTSGAFNPEVGNLVQLWGFGPDSPRLESAPEPASINEVLPPLTIKGYLLQGSGLYKKAADTRLDFSGVAKGYAVDRLVVVFRNFGYHHFLIEIGGELAVSGNGPGRNHGWRIAVINPDIKSDKFNEITLNNAAIATSGTYLNVFEAEGRNYSHIIRPQTGESVSALKSVSVQASSCALADALATGYAVFSLEELKSRDWKHIKKLDPKFRLTVLEQSANGTWQSFATGS